MRQVTGGGLAVEKQGQKRANEPKLTATDEKIIALLREDGQMANLELARQIGISERSVGRHMRRLEEEKLARVVLMLDLEADGYELLAAVGIKVKGRPPQDVADDIALIEQVQIVILVAGAYDLEIQVLARTMAELTHVLEDRIAGVEGVKAVAPSLATRISKHEYQWVPFT